MSLNHYPQWNFFKPKKKNIPRGSWVPRSITKYLEWSYLWKYVFTSIIMVHVCKWIAFANGIVLSLGCMLSLLLCCDLLDLIHQLDMDHDDSALMVTSGSYTVLKKLKKYYHYNKCMYFVQLCQCLFDNTHYTFLCSEEGPFKEPLYLKKKSKSNYFSPEIVLFFIFQSSVLQHLH